MHSSLVAMTNKFSHCDEYMKLNHDIFQLISTIKAHMSIICLQSAIFQSVRLILEN